jgi:hypothetical protein
MRITYRTLANLIGLMNDDQLDSDVTVEIASEDECYPAELRIAGENHCSLDDGHPVIYLNDLSDVGPRLDDVEVIAPQIGLM